MEKPATAAAQRTRRRLEDITKAYRNLGVTILAGARIEGLTESADAVTLTYRKTG